MFLSKFLGNPYLELMIILSPQIPTQFNYNFLAGYPEAHFIHSALPDTLYLFKYESILRFFYPLIVVVTGPYLF